MNMSRFRDILRTVVILAVSLSAFLSCVRMESSQDCENGYLAAPVLDVDVTVDDLNQTKALDFEIEAPSASEVHFIVKDKDSKVVYEGDGPWGEPLVLPTGAYTIDASVGVNGFGSPFFWGTTSGTVSALDVATPSIHLKLANALIKVTADESLTGHFIPGDKVILTPGSYEAPYGQWFYAPSVDSLSLALKGSNSAGNPAEFVYTLSSVAAKTAYNLICSKDSDNWPKITMNAIEATNVWASRAYVTNGAEFLNVSLENQNAVVYEAIPLSSSDWSEPVIAVNDNGTTVFKGLTENVTYKARARVGNIVSDNVVEFTPTVDGLSVSATHTYTSNELDGTDVLTTFTKSDLVKNAVSNWTINVCETDGTVLRSDLALGNSDGSTLTGTTDWPFLPVGNYKVTLSATMTDGEVITPEALAFSTTTPTFNVVVVGKTTYDYAQARDMNNANAVSGSRTAKAPIPSQSLFEIGSSVSIASNLMDNTNYSKTAYYAAYKDSTPVITTDGYIDYGTSRTHSLGDVYDAFSDWRSYLLSVKVDFAGTEYEGTKTFHVTGLPYTAAPPTKTGNHPWTEDQTNWGAETFSWGTSEFYMYDDNATGSYLRIGSPTFHIPSDVPVTIVTAAHGCRHALVNNDVTCRIYSGSSTADFTAKYNSGNYSDYTTNTLSLSTSSSKLQFENRHHTAYRKLYIKSVNIQYR